MSWEMPTHTNRPRRENFLVRRIMKRCIVHCPFSGSWDVCATFLQILLLIQYLTESLAQEPRTLVECFGKLYQEMMNGQQWFDIGRLINGSVCS
jgi:hypothetical protein